MPKPLLFVDTANTEEIKKIVTETGLLDGVTTNPSLIAKEWKRRGSEITGGTESQRILDAVPIWGEICTLDVQFVNIEVPSLQWQDMMYEVEWILLKVGDAYNCKDKLVFKFPCTSDGLLALKTLKKDHPNFKGNVTLVFNPTQAVLAAKAGAFFVSPFVGRLDDISEDGMGMVENIVSIYRKYNFDTMILAASIRNPIHVLRAFQAGVDVVSMPPETFWQLYKHPLTDSGIERFSKDWNS